MRELTRDELEELFGNEDNYAVIDGNGNCESVFPDRTAWAFCTNWSRYVRRVVGEQAQLFGFSEEENPTSKIAQEAGGHDFAVYLDRFIVDGWAKNVEQHCKNAIFDLKDPADASRILDLYGDRSKWDRNYGIECEIDEEKPHRREAALEGTNFQIDLAPAPAI